MAGVILGVVEARLPGIGVEIDDNGNPVIVAVDNETGSMVRIVLTAQAWQPFLSAAGRLRGVGIARANRADLVLPSDRNGG